MMTRSTGKLVPNGITSDEETPTIQDIEEKMQSRLAKRVLDGEISN